jgi:hypothetical protein
MKITTKAFVNAVFTCGLCLGDTVEAFAQCDVNAPATTPLQRFFDHRDGTLTDQDTGLMWKKCLEGQQGTECYGKPLHIPWELAIEGAQLTSHSRFAGYSDWRLPTLEELETIVERQCQTPAINLQVFPRMPAEGVWSGNDLGENLNAAGMDFNRGNPFKSLKAGGKYVRLVRNSG